MADKNAPFGLRHDGTPKSTGFLGRMKNRRGDVVTEFSVDEMVDGKMVHMPSVVPTLNASEAMAIMRSTEDGSKLPDSVYEKAVAHARERIKAGKSPFWNPQDDGAEVPAMPEGADPQTFLRSQQFQFQRR